MNETDKKKKEEKCPNCFHPIKEHYITEEKDYFLFRCSATSKTTHQYCECALWLMKNRPMGNRIYKKAKQEGVKILKHF